MTHVRGYIYVIVAWVEGGPRYFKIGKTVNWRRPWEIIRRQSPVLPLELDIAKFLECDETDLDLREKQFHERFASKRIRGEWFALDDSDLHWLAEGAGLEFGMHDPHRDNLIWTGKVHSRV